MTEQQIKATLSDEDALLGTMLAEAGGDAHEGGSSVEERIAVGCVVRNRLRFPTRWGDTYRAVCLQRKQFSCWNPGPDMNHQRLMALAYLLVTGQPLQHAVAEETRHLARGIIPGVILDNVHGATSYYAPKAMKPVGSKPFWAYVNGQIGGPEHPIVAVVGGQIFYRGV